MKNIIKTTAIATLVIGGGLTLSSCSKSDAQTSTTQTTPAKIMTASFTIEKMTCDTCPISVRKAMKRVDGVETVKVDFETKVAVVTYDADITTAAEIAAASTDVGYPATQVIS